MHDLRDRGEQQRLVVAGDEVNCHAGSDWHIVGRVPPVMPNHQRTDTGDDDQPSQLRPRAATARRRQRGRQRSRPSAFRLRTAPSPTVRAVARAAASSPPGMPYSITKPGNRHGEEVGRQRHQRQTMEHQPTRQRDTDLGAERDRQRCAEPPRPRQPLEPAAARRRTPRLWRRPTARTRPTTPASGRPAPGSRRSTPAVAPPIAGGRARTPSSPASP